MTPYKRFKLRAHDKGIDRHNKGTAYMRKQERIQQERAAAQPKPKAPRKAAKKLGSNVIRVDFALRTRLDPQVVEQLQAVAKEARRSTHDVAHDAAVRWGSKLQAL